MIIDRKQVKWARVTGLAGLISAGAYGLFRAHSPSGSPGGSAMGLFFGSAGFAIFLFECLLSLRKKFSARTTFRSYRLGRLQTWLRAHIWLGTLSFVLVLMHSGFHWGNGLAAILMWLLLIVVLSGLTGVAFQHYLPRRMKEVVERETIFEQIPRVIGKLREKADDRIRLANGVDLGGDAKQLLDARYKESIGPFLEEPPRASSAERFSTRKSVQDYFGDLRAGMPFPAHDTLKALEDICEERRQLAVQQRMHHWLHRWLLVHVPLSFGLLVLTAVHAALSLRY